jgi:magnesium chelatase family protein
LVDLPSFAIVSLANTTVGEVRAATTCKIRRCCFDGANCNLNIKITPTKVRRLFATDEPVQVLLKATMQKFHLSTCAFHHILKIARTITNFEKSDIIKAHHVAEAVQYYLR